MTIPKGQSIHNVSSISLICVDCDIFLRNDCTCHNGDRDGDQNTDLLDDCFSDNENISVWLQLQVVGNSLFQQLWVTCTADCLQLSLNVLRGSIQEIPHWWTEWAWNNREYVSWHHLGHILSLVNSCYDEFLPRAWWWAWTKFELEQLWHLKLLGWMTYHLDGSNTWKYHSFLAIQSFEVVTRSI